MRTGALSVVILNFFKFFFNIFSRYRATVLPFVSPLVAPSPKTHQATSMSFASEIKAFLHSLSCAAEAAGVAELDENISSYLSNLITDLIQDDTEVNKVTQIVEVAENFVEIDPTQLTLFVQALVDSLHSSTSSSSSSPPPTPPTPPPPEPDSPATTLYNVLNGEYSLKFLQYAATTGSINEIASTLMERSDPYLKLKASYDLHERKRAAAELEQIDKREIQNLDVERHEINQLNKAQVLERFQDEVVSSNSGVKKSKLKPKQNKAKKPTIDAASKIRFIDNEIVSRTGAKSIIIDDTVEWDGGSRGKVKSKGKRGIGFH